MTTEKHGLLSETLSTEFMLHLKKMYRERLQMTSWGYNATCVSEVLNFYTEAMMEPEWSEKKKNDFTQFLFALGFKCRAEGRKASGITTYWYFPMNSQNSDLQSICEEYEKSSAEAKNLLEQKARNDLNEFFKESSNVSVLKMDNLYYRAAVKNLCEKTENCYFKAVQSELWLYMSKDGKFYTLLEHAEELVHENVAYHMETFFKELNSYVKYYKRCQELGKEVVLERNFKTYMPATAYWEIKKVLEPLGFEFSHQPKTYASSYGIVLKYELPRKFTWNDELKYTSSTIRVFEDYPVFVTIPGFVKCRDLGYGKKVNDMYKNFFENYH